MARRSQRNHRLEPDQLITGLGDTFERWQSFGLRLEIEDGQPVFHQPYNPVFAHIQNDVHGGVIATMIDIAGWTVAAVHYPTWIVTIEFNVKLLDVANQEDLHSRGKLLRSGREPAVATMEVATKSGRLVAVGSGTYAVTSAPYSDASE